MKPRIRLAFILLLYGFCAVVLQTLLARELLVVFAGNEISLGFIFCFWFFGIALGAQFLRIHPEAAKKPEAYFTVFMLLFAITSAVLPLLIRSIGFIFDLQAGQFAPVGQLALATAIAVLPVSVLVGVLFPLSCLVWRGSEVGENKSIDSGSLIFAYGLDAAGGLVGGMGYTFYLVHHLHHLGQSVLCTILLCVATILSWTGKRFTCQRMIATLLSVFLVCFWFAGGLNWLEDWSRALRQEKSMAGDEQTVYLTTPYQSSSLNVKSGQTNLYTNGCLVSSFPDEYGDGELSRVVMSQMPEAKQVLVIGEGSEDLAKYFLPFGVDQMTLVGVDGQLHKAVLGAVTDESRQCFESGRAKFIEQDARRYVSACQGMYDLIWIRVQDPSTIAANRFFTREFYTSVQSCLKTGGVLAASATGSANYLGPELLETSGSLFATLRSVFAFVLAVPGDQHLFFASDSAGVLSGSPETLVKRFEQKKLKHSFDPEVVYSWFENERLKNFNSLLEAQAGIINTDARPAAYFHNLRLWLRFTGSGTNRLLGVLFQRGPYLIPTICALIMILAALIAVLRDRRRAPVRMHAGLLAVSTTGLACFSLELILIFGYQNRFGILYQWLGALFAVYMAGTVAGAWLCYSIKKWIRAPWLVASSELFVIVMAGALLLLLKLQPDAGWLFLLVNGLIGAAGGFQFAAVGAYLLPASGTGPGLANISSRMEWADHLGSMAGAAVTAVILVPVLGMTGAILLLGMIKIASFASVAWIVHPRRRKGGITSENG